MISSHFISHYVTTVCLDNSTMSAQAHLQAHPLSITEVQVFHTSLQPEPTSPESCLTPGEKVKADSIRLDAARNKYIQSRQMLRQILAAAVNRDPSDIDIRSGLHGKPYIPNGPFFNLSHSGNHIICALCHQAEVGIDIEQINSRLDVSKISEAVFSEHEQQELKQTPRAKRRSAFYTGWTRKEATLKGLGDGLTMATQDFDVSLSAFFAKPLIASRSTALKTSDWQLVDIAYFENTAGALAVHSRRPIRLFPEAFKGK